MLVPNCKDWGINIQGWAQLLFVNYNYTHTLGLCNYNYSYNYSHFGIVQLQLRGFIFFPISIAIAVIAITFQLPSQLHTVLWISISVLDLIKTIKESNTFHGWFLVKLIHFEMEHSEGKISCIKYMCSITTAITITRTLGLINYNYTHLWFD